MKLSVSAFRAHTSAQKKILSQNNQTNLNYGATSCTSPQASRLEWSRGVQKLLENNGSLGESNDQDSADEMDSSGNEDGANRGCNVSSRAYGSGGENSCDGDGGASGSASPPNRTKSNQRWMKLRTTVQLSGAITSTIQKKPPLKREDSFLKRFSTRQVPEQQETVDTGDDGEGDSEGNVGGFKNFIKSHRRKRKKYKKPPVTVVNPDGDFFYYWMMVVTICVLYNLWTLIVRQSFPELQNDYAQFWFTCDVISDVVFVLDIGVQFRTGYLEQGLMVYDSKKLAGHYVRSRAFLLDLGGIFPLELLQFNMGKMPILRCPRFFKVHRVYAYYYIVESRTVYPNVLRVMNLIHILLILAHWFGCFYYLLSEYEGFQGDWVYPYRPGAYATISRKYLASLYWSTLTLTTIGDLPTPESNAEYIFTIVGYLIGVFIFATIVGQVGNVITNRNANRLEFERLLDGAKTYMRHHKVPGGMKRRVLRWYDYSWSRGRIQGGGDINTALGLLPDKLKTELALHVNLSVLKKVTIFQECQPEFLHDLVLKMKAYIFTPGDLICRKGEVAREMFIIADGILEVMSETGRVLTTMKAGDFFGEIGILNLDGLNKRTADVRSVGYSELFSLSREDVLNAMKDYPEAQEILQSLGRKRLKEAQTINRAWKHSAMLQKERKIMAMRGSDNIGEISNRSRLDKLRLDVKELRNVLRKSRKSSRAKQEGVELESLSRSHEGSAPCKGVLSRMPRIYNDDTSYEEDSLPSPPKLGAGLPLLQRLKLLKEKQDAEKTETKKLVPSTPPSETAEKKEADTTSLPLLQRILLHKQKEEAESNIMQNTANMTAQVLASTVRTQTNAPAHQQLLKSRNKSTDEPPKPCLKGSVKFRELVKIGGSRKTSASVSDVTLKDGSNDTTPAKCRSISCSSADESSSKQSLFFTNQESADKESWKLIKKAVVVQPTNPAESTHAMLTVDSASISTVRKELSIVREDNASEKSSTENLDCQKSSLSKSDNLDSLSAIRSAKSEDLSSASEGNQLNSAQLFRNAQLGNENVLPEKNKGDKNAQKLNLDHLKKLSASEDSRFPRRITSGSRRTEKVKIYKSIDDLSPEYSGLPFVKKLKILNERQKLAELERNSFIRSCSLDSASGQESELGETLTRSHSEALAMEVVIRNQQSRQSEGISADNVPLGDNGKSFNRLGSPESNETEERRELKSILKKLSSGSLMQSVCGSHTEPQSSANTASSTLLPDIKKLMRAQTVEGYAARHSKFTKSVTFNRVAVESCSCPSTPSSDNVFLSSPNDTLAFQLPTIEDPPVAAEANEPGEQQPTAGVEEAGSSFDSTATVNPDIIPMPVSIKNDNGEHLSTNPNINNDSLLVGTSKRYTSGLFSPALVIEHRHNETYANYESMETVSQINKMECIGNFFGELRQLLEEHLEKTEFRHINIFQNLEQEVRKRDIIICQLQKRIWELEGGTNGTSSAHNSIDFGENPFVRGLSVETVLRGDGSKESDEVTDEAVTPEPWPSEAGASNFQIPLDNTRNKDYTCVNINIESSSTDTEDELRYNYNWEVQMLAEELTDREEGNRRRAVSFDSAQPSGKETERHRTRSLDHGKKGTADQATGAQSLEVLKKEADAETFSRRLSISSLQKTFSSTLRRGLHMMKNGIPSSPDVVPAVPRSLRSSSHPPTNTKSNPQD